VLPSSRGGKNTWLNTVAACSGCNQRKGDRTPAEAGMVLRFTPTAPSWYAVSSR
jgi:5-methylcytosine-specific restriction endonuclease McrA